MADNANRARHAFGSEANISEALAAGKIDAYDILFLDEKKVGWVTKDGEVVIAEGEQYVVNVAELPTTNGKEGVVYIYNNEAYIWNSEESKCISICKPTDLTALETAISSKAEASEVEALEERVNAEFKKNATQMYEVAKAPEGTLVDYFDKEIRILIPKSTDFANLNNGIAGAENMRYVECRIYAPEGAVGYKSDLGGMVMAGKVEDFAGFTDERGKVYIITFPSIAYYDTESAAWVYYGANSTTKHYEGWNHTIEWFDENDVAIASDSVKINLSNEDCHYAVEPYYVGEMMAEIDTKIEEEIDKKIAEVTAIEVVEF